MNLAVVYLLLATSLYSIINLGVKFLGHLPASEIVVSRQILTLLISAYFLWRKGGRFVGTNRKLLFARGLFGSIALLAFFTCLQKVPFAVAMTLINLTPIFTVIIAHFYLKERASPTQWALLLLAFLGVVMVRGGVEPVPWVWMGLGLLAALFASVTYTVIRELRTTEDPLVVILYFPLVTLPLVTPLAAYEFVTPQGLDWLILLAIGGLTQAAQYFMTVAYQLEKAAKIMVFNYISLLWGVLFGWTLFQEALSTRQLLGVLLVFLCLCLNFLVTLRKRKWLAFPRKIF
jgi:drug/metabolite transporter (DMT)-like permease